MLVLRVHIFFSYNEDRVVTLMNISELTQVSQRGRHDCDFIWSLVKDFSRQTLKDPQVHTCRYHMTKGRPIKPCELCDCVCVLNMV